MSAYLICATPRTGSSLLCGLLDSTGVAGHPESYFREPDRPSWAESWGLSRSFSEADYVRAAIAAGSTDNGVFAARIMWGTAVDLLDPMFGDPRFVHLRRRDVVAQAVSWWRAEQTGRWFETTDAAPAPAAAEPRFDFAGIHALVRTIDEHNAAWRGRFAALGIRPYRIEYEDLAADPVAVTAGVLDFLGLRGEREIRIHHHRLADEVNAEWAERYRTELATRPTAAPGSSVSCRPHRS